jgi:pyruvate dehydrogenase E1 component alpha subunit
MRSASVEGNNVLEVYRVIKEAVEHARATSEPSLIEIHTFRYRGHSMSDPVHGHYRSKEEVEEQKRLDPITLLGDTLKSEGIITDDYFDAAEKRVKKIVEEAVEYSEASPEPPLEELWTDVYFTKEGN